MKCTIIGAGSGLPHPDFHQSSLIVEVQQKVFLVDCGEGASRQILKHGYNKDRIDAILISHYHPDHVSGIFMLFQMLYLEKRTKPLQVFLPENPSSLIDVMHMFYTFEQKFSFELLVYETESIGQFYPEITSYQTDHLSGYDEIIKKHGFNNKLKSFSFCFNESGKKLLYTSDITTLHNIKQISDEADIVIIDALHPEADLIKNIKLKPKKKVILNHGISKYLKDWLDNNPSQHYELVSENSTYVL
ncbi:MAG: ribonuclease Z [Candidatus Cloacimonetes bacterium]|nr:ribonuclease Z [Candidatus Cloacimonadota bacterium]